MCFLEKRFEDVPMRIEGGERDCLPGFTCRKVSGFRFADSTDKNERFSISQNMLSGTGNQRKLCVYCSVREFELLGLDGQMSHARCQSPKDGLDDTDFLLFCRSMYALSRGWARLCQLRPLMKGHPVQEPRVRVIFDVDLDIDQHTATDEGSAMAHSSLRDGSNSAEACETKALYKC
jgi:hypothetical protein